MPRNKYPEETVQKILDSAAKLFMEKGYEQTTVLDIIANMGGLTRGAFYHHFKSKEEVLGALLQQAWEEEDYFERAMNAKVSNGLERVKLALKFSMAHNSATEKDAALTKIMTSNVFSPRFLALRHETNLETAKQLQPMIEEGMADGSIKPGNAILIAELFMLLMNFWIFPNIFPDSSKDFIDKGKMIEQIFNMLGFPIIDDEFKETFLQLTKELEW